MEGTRDRLQAQLEIKDKEYKQVLEKVMDLSQPLTLIWQQLADSITQQHQAEVPKLKRKIESLEVRVDIFLDV